jgi:putative ABC transport system permease protein
MPFDGAASDDAVTVDGQPQRPLGLTYVLPGYFETVAIPLRRGRFPDSGDVRSGAEVAVLSESAARVLFPHREALGATVHGRRRQFVVVGVVADVRKRLDGDSSHPVYVIPKDDTRRMTVVVRTRARHESLLVEIKRQVSAMAPMRPVEVGWWTDSIAAVTAYRNPRFQTLVLGSFSGLALLMIAVGIFGAVTSLVTLRTREMGVRLAVGATPGSLVSLAMRQTFLSAALGVVVGLVATRWVGRIAEAQLFAVESRDPLTSAAAVVTVLGAAGLAAYLPARRAGSVDPIVALRSE